MMARRVVIAGASNQLGHRLAPKLCERGWHPLGLARSRAPTDWPGEWFSFDLSRPDAIHWPEPPAAWVHAAPISLLPAAAFSCQQVIVFSSTSAETKARSASATERELARTLAAGEQRAMSMAESAGCQCHIIRPTLIWGCGRDRNITALWRWLQRYRLLPVAINRSGLRQPVHVDDLALAVLQLLDTPHSSRVWTLPGAEALAYSDMLRRIQRCVAGPSRIQALPEVIWRALLLCLPTAKRQSVHAMLQRMGQNLDFPSKDWEALGIEPRGFQPSRRDFNE